MKSQQRLFGESLEQAAAPLLRELGSADRERLNQLISLARADSIGLADALKIVAPQKNPVDAQAALRTFRKRVNDVSKEHKVPLTFHVDSKKKNPVEHRTCWLQGKDAAIVNAARFSSESIASQEPSAVIPQLAIATSTSALKSGKRLVRFFSFLRS